MTIAVFPGRDYAADMQRLADEMRRNTHIVVARNRVTGETQSFHARPRREAVEYSNTLRGVLSREWRVQVVRVRAVAR